ncbi:60S ribosomal protein L5 [Onygenales sp. PD_40]|nr:60S ribosomal protein L5 [Onygenales sp. PD_40]
MKGVSDDSIFISHSENYFLNYNIKTKELNTETLCKYIFSSYITEYMEGLTDVIHEDSFKKEEGAELKKIKTE